MNQLINYLFKLSLISLFYLSAVSTLWASGLQVNWQDNSSNEDVFIVEKRLLQSDTFQRVITLPANSTNYQDMDVIAGETYCYRISTLNQAGESFSDVSCLAVIEATPSHTDPVTPSGNISISHQFISKPKGIELNNKKLFSFKSDVTYNDWYSEDDISNVQFDTNEGVVSYRNRNYFSFKQDGEELENGYASMKFNTKNQLSFTLQGSGISQVATLYMKAGAWSKDVSSIIVAIGDTEERITLPKGYKWYYISVDIEFDGTAPVVISTDADRPGYSRINFAGLVLNNTNAPKYAALVSVDYAAGSKIDVTDLEYMTSHSEYGNTLHSGAQVESLSFYGKTKPYHNVYSFTDLDDEVGAGFRRMSWNEKNGVKVKATSTDSQIDVISLYFKAGVWSHETAFVNIIINGESELVELTSGYSWDYMKVDIEFEGELDLDIHPMGVFKGYSAFSFAGLTLN